ncbi:MAG TPA: pseudouridine synthase [Candidatus Paceibacterota bacterium]|jgi:23S rRNA pseudouridine2604 synthase
MPDFPMRLNKYLAHKGYATRRAADDLIERGRVLVNGRVAQLGDKVDSTDTVEVRQSKRAKKQSYAYFAYNKPRGIVSHSPGEREEDIRDSLPELGELGVFPIGRLDKNSHGLIILTNDGRITDRLLNPDREHDKEYTVRTKLPLRKSFKKHIEEGVDIEGYLTKPAKVRVLGEKAFALTLNEGKKHQVRRMVVAMHNEVEDLKRNRILNIRLGNLKSGQVRPIEGDELAEFLARLGLGEPLEQ